VCDVVLPGIVQKHRTGGIETGVEHDQSTECDTEVSTAKTGARFKPKIDYSKQKKRAPTDTVSDVETAEFVQIRSTEKQKKRLKQRVGESSRVKSRKLTDTESDVEFTEVAENRSTKKQKKRLNHGEFESSHVKMRRRNCKWRTEELKQLRICFQEFFKQKRPPDFSSIIAAQERYPNLCKRTKAQIKSRTLHIIQTGH